MRGLWKGKILGECEKGGALRTGKKGRGREGLPTKNRARSASVSVIIHNS